MSLKILPMKSCGSSDPLKTTGINTNPLPNHERRPEEGGAEVSEKDKAEENTSVAFVVRAGFAMQPLQYLGSAYA